MNKTCPECNEPIVGRIDKKFCSDQCRNSYNNRENRKMTNYIRNVNTKLQKNRRVLDDFVPDEKATVHKEMLLKKGFDFNFFTNIYTTKTGKVYYFCYEMGYLPIENDFYAIVRRHE